MGIAELLDVEETVEKTHILPSLVRIPRLVSMGDLARLLAVRIMEHRLIPHHFSVWEAHANGGGALSARERAAIVAFIKPAFGIPEEPAINIDHLEGLVSQYLWYFVYKEISKEEVVKDIPPGSRKRRILAEIR